MASGLLLIDTVNINTYFFLYNEIIIFMEFLYNGQPIHMEY